METLKKMTRRAIKTSSYLLFPFLVGLFVTADHLVPVILTEKWVPCIPYLRVFCVVYIFMPLQTTNMQIYKGIGKSDISLVLEVIKKTIGVLGLLISVHFGPFAIAVAYAITTIVNCVISALPNKRIINYGVVEQCIDILPNILLSISFVIPLLIIGKLNLPHVVILIIQVLLAVVIYIGVSELLKIDAYKYIKKLIRSKDKTGV